LFIPVPDPDFLPIPDPGVNKASDPASGSATPHPVSVFIHFSFALFELLYIG
jgi:hypothetical protein